MTVFDLDDTLFYEKDFCRSAYEEIAVVLGARYRCDLSFLPVKMGEALNNRENPFDVMREALGNRGLSVTEDDVREMVELYRHHAPEYILPMRGAGMLFDALRRRDVRIGIITDGRSYTQRNKLHATGLDKYIAPEDILISGECGSDKTSPLMFEKMMAMHPEEAGFRYVGDNTQKDFRHPNLLGWDTVCLRHYRPGVHPQNFSAVWPDAPRRIISALPELLF